MVNPSRIASTTAVMPDALMTELTPIPMEHRPNMVGRCSFNVSGSTLPSSVPSRPPSSTAPQFVNTPIGITFLSFFYERSFVLHARAGHARPLQVKFYPCCSNSTM